MTKPIIVVKMPCKTIAYHLIKNSDFLALLDIKVFDRLYVAKCCF